MMRPFLKKKSKAPLYIPPQEPPPEIIKVVEEEFPDEDTATKREHFERVISASPATVFQVFGGFVWRENAGVTEVEILKDSKVKGELEVGMVRRTAGYEEEIITVKHNKIIEYRILDGMPTTFHKSRIIFKPEEDGAKTRVIWTIWWSPTNMVAGIMYTVMMKGFCNLALYRLDQKITGDAQQSEEDGSSRLPTSADSTMDDSSDLTGPEDLSVDLNEGEVPKLQWAARMQTGYEGNLTPDQAEVLNEFRDDLKKHDPEVWQLCQAHPDGADRIMLRFLRAECYGRARKFNVEKSKKRLCETLRFRRDVGADKMLTVAPPKFDEFTASGGEFVVTDREGRVTVFTRAGLLSTCIDTKIMTEEQWKMNLVCVTERRNQILRENSKRLGHEVSASVVVYDVRGVSFASRKILPFTKMINDVASKHYPESVDIIVVAFAPAIFTTIFASIKVFLDPVTASKVRVFGTSKAEVEKMSRTLRSILDPKVLPKEFGGDSDAVVGYPSNYTGPKFPNNTA